MTTSTLISPIILCVTLLQGVVGASTLELAGTWGVRLDPKAIGEKEAWWNEAFTQTCRLPGSLSENGIGDPIGFDTDWKTKGYYKESIDRVAKEFLSTGKFLVYPWMNPGVYYVGKAWYQKECKLPHSPTGTYRLHLERTHWRSSAWVNGKKLGSRTSLYTPHDYTFKGEGRARITVCVDNSRSTDLPIGNPAHGLSDQTQGMWNGMTGSLRVEALPTLEMGEGRWVPRFGTRNVSVTASLTGAPADEDLKVVFTLKDHSGQRTLTRKSFPLSRCLAKDTMIQATFPVPQTIQAWDEFTPVLYHAELALTKDTRVLAATAQNIGFRDVRSDRANKRLLLNGEPLFIRSTLDCAIFPLTGYPPTDAASWEKALSQIKAYGCNAVRFHSYTPPEAAFVAADSIGLYLQPEMCWARAGHGNPIDQWLKDEGKRIIERYGDHPSFLFFACGNEMGGPSGGRSLTFPPFHDIPNKDSTFNRIMATQPAAEYLSTWVPAMESVSSLQFVAGSAGWPYIVEEAFHMHHEPLRLKGIYEHWGPRSTWDYSSVVDAYTRPLVSHETGQFGSYPSLDSLKKFTGVYHQDMLKIIELRLKKSGIYHQHRDFTRVSGTFQALFYKEGIEALRRTPGLGGYQLLALQDFTGQGAAFCGVLDPFYDDKGYCSAEEFSRFNAPTVALAMMEKRTWTTDERFSATVRIAHNGQEPLAPTTWEWTLSSNNETIGRGAIASSALAIGDVKEIGTLTVPLNTISEATKLTLTMCREGGLSGNSWTIWVYPSTLPAEDRKDVLITREITPKVRDALASGGTVIVSPDKSQMKVLRTNMFEAPFWKNTAASYGLLIQSAHPALKHFPADEFKTLNWWEPLRHSTIISLDELPKAIAPIIQVVDNPYECRKLAFVFEAKCGAGKVIFSAIDLMDDLESRPVSRQLRYSLLKYATSAAFQPKETVTLQHIQSLMPNRLQKKTAYTGVSNKDIAVVASSEVAGYEASRLIDGDDSTLWHTPWGNSAPTYPHEVTLIFKTARQLEGIEIVPRKMDTRNIPKTIELYTSLDGEHWGKPTMTLTLENAPNGQVFYFPSPDTCKAIKLTITAGHGHNTWTSLAEVIPISQFGEQAGQ